MSTYDKVELVLAGFLSNTFVSLGIVLICGLIVGFYCLEGISGPTAKLVIAAMAIFAAGTVTGVAGVAYIYKKEISRLVQKDHQKTGREHGRWS